MMQSVKHKLFQIVMILCLTALLSCQEEDFGFTSEEIKASVYDRNFEKKYGSIDANQTWDFSTYALEKNHNAEQQVEKAMTRADNASANGTIEKRYLIEDLGSLDVWDFNDIVIDVVRTSQDTRAFLRSLCGTLPFSVKIGSQLLTTSVNTNGVFQGRTANGSHYDPSSNTAEYGEFVSSGIVLTNWDPDANNISVIVFENASAADDVRTLQSLSSEQVNKVSKADFPDHGAVPRIICCDTDVKLADEDVDFFTVPQSATISSGQSAAQSGNYLESPVTASAYRNNQHLTLSYSSTDAARDALAGNKQMKIIIETAPNSGYHQTESITITAVRNSWWNTIWEGSITVKIGEKCEIIVDNLSADDMRLISKINVGWNQPNGDANVTFTAVMIGDAQKELVGNVVKSNNDFNKGLENLVKKAGATKADIKHIVFKGHDDSKPTLPYTNLARDTKTHTVYAAWDASSQTVILTTPADIISSEANCSYMFQTLTGLESIDFKGFDTSSATTFDHMLQKCPSLKSVDMRGLNTEKVKSLNNLCAEDAALETVYLGCTKTSLDDELDTNPSNTGSFSRLFNQCTSLKQVDLSGVDVHDATNARLLFAGCTSLEKVVFGNSMAKVTDVKQMFEGACAQYFECKDANFESLKEMSQMFKSCKAETVDLSGWKLTSCTSTNYLFGESQLKNIILKDWYLPQVNNMSQMFVKTPTLEKIDFGASFAYNEGVNLNYFITEYNYNNLVFVASQQFKNDLMNRLNTSGPNDVKKTITSHVTWWLY